MNKKLILILILFLSSCFPNIEEAKDLDKCKYLNVSGSKVKYSEINKYRLSYSPPMTKTEAIELIESASVVHFGIYGRRDEDVRMIHDSYIDYIKKHPNDYGAKISKERKELSIKIMGECIK